MTMPSLPPGLVPRPESYRFYWYFAAERQAIFDLRANGDAGPWTEDPILQTFKFCNVYRASDRVSQYMIQNVCYHSENCTPQDRLFQIVAFRTFSKIETWEGLRHRLGHYPTIADLADGRFAAALDDIRLANGGLYTGAFILCANDAYGQRIKHRNHVELFRHMFVLEDLGDALLAANSLREVYELLRRFPLMGAFMAYQTAVDLNYSAIINFSENDFTQAGPGALRGIKKIFSSTGAMSPEQVISWMVENQVFEFERLGLRFNGLWGRPLQAIDCQGLFCEVDKYCREAIPDLASARKRIKARFRPTGQPVELFFPPKWGLNHSLPRVRPPEELPGQSVLF